MDVVNQLWPLVWLVLYGTAGIVGLRYWHEAKKETDRYRQNAIEMQEIRDRSDIKYAKEIKRRWERGEFKPGYQQAQSEASRQREARTRIGMARLSSGKISLGGMDLQWPLRRNTESRSRNSLPGSRSSRGDTPTPTSQTKATGGPTDLCRLCPTELLGPGTISEWHKLLDSRVMDRHKLESVSSTLERISGSQLLYCLTYVAGTETGIGRGPHTFLATPNGAALTPTTGTREPIIGRPSSPSRPSGYNPILRQLENLEEEIRITRERIVVARSEGRPTHYLVALTATLETLYRRHAEIVRTLQRSSSPAQLTSPSAEALMRNSTGVDMYQMSANSWPETSWPMTPEEEYSREIALRTWRSSWSPGSRYPR